MRNSIVKVNEYNYPTFYSDLVNKTKWPK